jgi:hypothetical protein
MMILSYKAVGTFDRISAVLLIFDIVLFNDFLTGIKFFVDLVFVFLLTDRANCIDCFSVNRIVCRKAGLIIS